MPAFIAFIVAGAVAIAAAGCGGVDKPLPVTPQAGYPCGVTGVDCGGGMCCGQYDVCGGPAFAGCPAGECCNVGGDAYGAKRERPQWAAKP